MKHKIRFKSGCTAYIKSSSFGRPGDPEFLPVRVLCEVDLFYSHLRTYYFPEEMPTLYVVERTGSLPFVAEDIDLYADDFVEQDLDPEEPG